MLDYELRYTEEVMRCIENHLQAKGYITELKDRDLWIHSEAPVEATDVCAEILYTSFKDKDVLQELVDTSQVRLVPDSKGQEMRYLVLSW